MVGVGVTDTVTVLVIVIISVEIISAHTHNNNKKDQKKGNCYPCCRLLKRFTEKKCMVISCSVITPEKWCASRNIKFVYVPCTVHSGEGTGVISVIQVEDVSDGEVVVLTA